jgi:hypothetical protein
LACLQKEDSQSFPATAPEDQADQDQFPLRRIKLHERMMSLGEAFSEVDFEPKTAQNRPTPHPPYRLLSLFQR